ncbi:exported hypothetical protein [Nitrospina gracilis 3/211]|uniref:Uncharacterized protein n=1 Tax=Nitrospina gracilis (strain 3/211) TaxID=1266370 RepID=M1Z298_NITG3|nr:MULTISPECIES: hypothetical protein [Nitrospina]MCF8724673.1 hypothetical protein [Nitrospina sp. Nb-3]CCQ91856.1 exported hypothetical protein [Nitrospina gracilis 3/211]
MNAFFRNTALGFAVWVAAFAAPVAGLSAENRLDITTDPTVTGDGRVTITLHLRNTGSRPLHHVHPMFHFHHTMAHMPMIHELKPGQEVTLVNDQHPPVRRVGSYPVVAMVNYKTGMHSDATRTQLHTDSFHYEEPLKALITGDIRARHQENTDTSTLRIALRNDSPSFKNVRLMLLLPPELTASQFSGMMGFTIHGGQEKHFEVPVKKVAGRPGGEYPVHLLVEYGEMLKHYSSDITGSVYFGPDWGEEPFWPQMLVFLFLFLMLVTALVRRWRHRRRNAY